MDNPNFSPAEVRHLLTGPPLGKPHQTQIKEKRTILGDVLEVAPFGRDYRKNEDVVAGFARNDQFILLRGQGQIVKRSDLMGGPVKYLWVRYGQKRKLSVIPVI